MVNTGSIGRFQSVINQVKTALNVEKLFNKQMNLTSSRFELIVNGCSRMDIGFETCKNNKNNVSARSHLLEIINVIEKCLSWTLSLTAQTRNPHRLTKGRQGKKLLTSSPEVLFLLLLLV